MRPEGPRDTVVGPDSGPTPPFPLKLNGEVVKGFGRGSLTVGGHQDIESGVYYGYASLSSTNKVYPQVMSIGWNPFYKNSVRSVEVHVLNKFEKDFYGSHMNLVILGFIRPEYDYVSKESLIEDIEVDVEVARRSLEREGYAKFKEDPYLLEFEGKSGVAS
ncbi:unnamed protein product [Aureobasidium pullulans]|nr:unnamed protein product [Aureobasidium pullulans]